MKMTRFSSDGPNLYTFRPRGNDSELRAEVCNLFAPMNTSLQLEPCDQQMCFCGLRQRQTAENCSMKETNAHTHRCLTVGIPLGNLFEPRDGARHSAFTRFTHFIFTLHLLWAQWHDVFASSKSKGQQTLDGLTQKKSEESEERRGSA